MILYITLNYDAALSYDITKVTIFLQLKCTQPQMSLIHSFFHISRLLANVKFNAVCNVNGKTIQM